MAAARADDAITSPDQVPDAYLRLVNIAKGLDEMAAHAHALIDDVGEVMETFGVPLFESDAENEAVYKRAEALRSDQGKETDNEAAQGGPADERSDMVAIAPTHDDARTIGGNAHLEDVSAPSFLTGDVTIPAATLFEAITRLAAHGEMFWRLEESDPSIGMDDDGFTLGLLSRMTGDFPEDDAAYEQHPPIVAFEAAARERAAELLRNVAKASYSILRDDTVTNHGLEVAVEGLEADARLIRESGNAEPHSHAPAADEKTPSLAGVIETCAQARRRFVELEALSDFLMSIVGELESLRESSETILSAVDRDTLLIDDGYVDRPGQHEALRSVFPGGYTEVEETAEGHLVVAEQSALTARLFALLGSDAARERVLALSARAAGRAESYARSAQL